MRTLTRFLMLGLVAAGVAGCSVAATPFRVAADVVRIVPVVGDVVAVPLDATGNVID